MFHDCFFLASVVLSAIDTGDGSSIIETWIGVGFVVGVLLMFMFALVLMLLLKLVLLFVMDDVVVLIVFVFVKFNLK